MPFKNLLSLHLKPVQELVRAGFYFLSCDSVSTLATKVLGINKLCGLLADFMCELE